MTEVALKYPIQDLEDPTKKINTVTVKDRIKGSDMLVLDQENGEVASSLAIIGRMPGLAPSQVEALDSVDIAALSDVIQKKSQA